MNTRIKLESVYAISDDFVYREIEGELIIVPISGGVGDLEDGLFSMNESGKAIWRLIDGERNVSGIINVLRESFSIPAAHMERDVKGFMFELFKRGMIIER